MSDFVRQNAAVVDFNTSDSWVILSPIELSIKKKIEAVGVPLKDWDINIYRGVLTGYNEAFIISTEKRDEILSNCQSEEERQRTEELIRPILRGRDIKRYGYDWAGLYLIATFPSRHYDIEQYPAVKAHLLSFGMERLEQTGKESIVNGQKVKARKKTNNKWFETQDSISYWDDFSKPKIVYREISVEMEACLAPESWMINNKLYMITSNSECLEYICAFLNSKLFSKIIMSSVNFGGGKGVDFLGSIKLPYFDKCGVFDLSQNAIAIDPYFYQLFGLTTNEIEFIETL
jgi:hypothetical protein